MHAPILPQPSLVRYPAVVAGLAAMLIAGIIACSEARPSPDTTRSPPLHNGIKKVTIGPPDHRDQVPPPIGFPNAYPNK